MFEQAIHKYCSEEVLTEAVSESSLRYSNTLKYTISRSHLVWQDASFDSCPFIRQAGRLG